MFYLLICFQKKNLVKFEEYVKSKDLWGDGIFLHFLGKFSLSPENFFCNFSVLDLVYTVLDLQCLKIHKIKKKMAIQLKKEGKQKAK